ncbi:hypothetical protein [Novosphingobium sp.]|jgi:hypothetical protein|uniref:hypothetical protein n=1 Tax=Novosphingobium sp. TaxID=1874826 RepID=UPI0022C4154D|nr:hypothetical protein [Novosphingobium sp.]MCZ8017399.1 hypothetical protein [Novosphingobium sp.]MCZ8034078.1 hypothetical protein [Novosphingobium sp.]MCZ8051433.1 hypothetical protein [Novosphingobium sp.]MCZ8059779.1 hypothetical protein [Novosphingobium sp.]MCZ8231617.1 hypothetical protein [Novosphingobium sp.]
MIRLLTLAAFLATSTAVAAEPTNRWWSGGGMGVSEYGWSGSDRTTIYMTCEGDDELGLRVSIRGVDPKPKSQVIFEVNGQSIVFFVKSDGDIEMQSRVSMNNLYFLFEELRSGRQVTVNFDGLSKTLPLTGSAKGLGKGLCK